MDSVRSVLLAALGVVLVGCTTLENKDQDLPVEKVVLDWKDFYPTKFSLMDDCNTLHTKDKTYLSKRTLCFADKSSLGDDQFYLYFTESRYNKKQWKYVDSLLSDDGFNVLSYLAQGSNSICKKNYRAVSATSYTCTPMDDSVGNDILYVQGHRKMGNGTFVESVVLKSIQRNHVVNKEDWEYKTATRIIDESFDKL